MHAVVKNSLFLIVGKYADQYRTYLNICSHLSDVLRSLMSCMVSSVFCSKSSRKGESSSGE